ncbi:MULTISPECIES: sugar phosphate isomerase/epimerase family protein [unclassified Streptomyces]|uniref:sugar phosphate isomerase/epimerase family protein n=1 Tax=unclassified Streptomyces TaxID=2593676 RepID=UPI000F6B87E6|nr:MULTISPECIES: sugar phosphate isomerase/epimerase family protein [unclassified Streptomyces]AZM62172.1 xylose isomerase [Streptomyces sp. WAC 01438]RSN00090.1 xylose isomerase [Streptomyces sp. WAC 01420]
MKFAFSTLGVPGLALGDVVGLATAHGYHGVELRAHAEEPVHADLTPAQRADVAAEFKEAGVEILGLAGYARVAAPGADEPVLAELRALLNLARDIGAPFVRVFPGGGTGQSPEEADATAARRLGSAAEHAADQGVRILLETHDSHRTGADAMRVLGLVGHPRVGALWDVMHTWLGGEQPAESFAALSPHLGYVQVKDIASAEDTTPLPLGAGVLPLAEVVEVLSRHNWDGWLCWEYEKRWYETAAPLPGLLTPGREHLARLLTESA